ncbi:hypothetical protein P4G36_12905 [Escherichia coli]|uniref:hypothetical protein n=1 Tax=Enterobacteriaceae TaxID=543 RepID=UPI000E5C7C77|nr:MULTISPECIES: hypothetical protein [Enterobacteriaceae]EGF7274019.1 hypothetical protein [Shigella flexneri]EES2676038.1 hypothetical protein [Escherichia coli]EFB5173529.1 hypothetical protein [Escherichia coli]EFB9408229.1 hypothetical protein [Escherichia coli]EFC4276830.1 hypothetical protein [Escherichia coli]
MSERQNRENILDREYAGFFTESAKEDLTDVINLVSLISVVFGDKNGGASAEIINEEIVSLSNIIYRELQTIKSGMHLSGGIFSWHSAEKAGIAKAISNE